MASESKKDEETVPFPPSSSPGDEEFPADILRDQAYYGRTWNRHFEVSPEFAPPPPPPTITTSCSWNYTSAIANNCRFQLWSYSLAPPGCFDEQLNDDFLALRAEEDWHYYSSLSPLIEVPLDSVLAGNRNDLYSTWGQHFWHCAFYQRKFFRIVEENGGERTSTLKMTNRDLEEHHEIHCQEWLANPKKYPWDKVNINLTVGYHFYS